MKRNWKLFSHWVCWGGWVVLVPWWWSLFSQAAGPRQRCLCGRAEWLFLWIHRSLLWRLNARWVQTHTHAHTHALINSHGRTLIGDASGVRRKMNRLGIGNKDMLHTLTLQAKSQPHHVNGASIQCRSRLECAGLIPCVCICLPAALLTIQVFGWSSGGGGEVNT